MTSGRFSFSFRGAVFTSRTSCMLDTWFALLPLRRFFGKKQLCLNLFGPSKSITNFYLLPVVRVFAAPPIPWKEITLLSQNLSKIKEVGIGKSGLKFYWGSWFWRIWKLVYPVVCFFSSAVALDCSGLCVLSAVAVTSTIFPTHYAPTLGMHMC